MENLFEMATRKKFRFETLRGSVTVEDLWDMPLQSRDKFDLDEVAIQLSNDIEEVKSFVVERRVEDVIAKAKLDLVVHIIKTKLAEAKENEEAGVRAEKKERILQIIKNKQDAKLEEMSEEELQQQLGELSA